VALYGVFFLPRQIKRGNLPMIFVKVIRVPGAVVEVGLDDGATVADALDAASITVATNEQVSVNGANVGTNHVLEDNARLVVARAAKSATD
jgi:hypothetical protein